MEEKVQVRTSHVWTALLTIALLLTALLGPMFESGSAVALITGAVGAVAYVLMLIWAGRKNPHRLVRMKAFAAVALVTQLITAFGQLRMYRVYMSEGMPVQSVAITLAGVLVPVILYVVLLIWPAKKRESGALGVIFLILLGILAVQSIFALTGIGRYWHTVEDGYVNWYQRAVYMIAHTFYVILYRLMLALTLLLMYLDHRKAPGVFEDYKPRRVVPAPAQQPVQQPVYRFDPQTGAPIEAAPNGYNGTTPIAANDGPHKGFGALGFFFPVVGLIVFLTDKAHPQRSRSCGKGAIAGAIVWTVLVVLIYVIEAVILANIW